MTILFYLKRGRDSVFVKVAKSEKLVYIACICTHKVYIYFLFFCHTYEDLEKLVLRQWKQKLIVVATREYLFVIIYLYSPI